MAKLVNSEYFNIEFSNDIIDLFLEFKEINKDYCCDLINEKHNSYYLIEFLSNQLIYNINESIDNENNYDINNIFCNGILYNNDYDLYEK